MEDQMKKSERKWESSYGWVVVGAGLIITMIVYGINFSFAVLFKPLLQSFQWGRGQTALIWAANWVTFSVVALLIGPLTDRFGARRTMLAGSCLFCSGILFSSQATSLLHLSLLFGMLGSVGLVSTLMPLVVTVTRWFDQRQGLALGMAQSFNTGTIIISPLAAWLAINYGWQQAFLVLGVLALVTVVPLTVFIREPQGISSTVAQERRVSDSSQDFNLRQAWRTRTYWSLKLMVLGCCTCHSFLLLHLVNYLTDQGLAISRAAMFYGLLGVASACGRIVNGMCADRLGAKPAIAGFLFVQGLGILLFLRPDQFWLLYLGTIAWGMAQGGPMSCYPMLYRKYFGKRHLATLMSGFYAIAGLGMALGGLLGGVLYDVTGGYQLSFAISLIGGVGAALIAMTLQPPDRSLMGEHRGFDQKPVPA
jgi:predicted MFS family arabinose efflux permease